MIRFNGLDRIYDEYSWRITRRAKEVWRSGNVVSSRHTEGSHLDRFEKSVAKHTGRKHAVAVGSGTDALYFALRAKGVGPGSVVLCPSISYLATAEAIVRTGASVQFIDVDHNGHIGTLPVIGYYTAVVYVNLFGNLADYDSLRKYCDRRSIPLIEDAAQSFGSTYGDQPSGKLGDISSLSFAPSKPLPCFGNGGMVLTDSSEERDTVRSLRYHGTGTAKLSHGYNSCLPNDHANVLNFLLSKYKKLLGKSAKVREWYDSRLAEMGIHSLRTRKGSVSNNHKYVIKVNDREELQNFLHKKEIETQVHYKTPLHKMTMFATNDELPASDKFCSEVL